MAKTLVEVFHPKRAVDVGCGSGRFGRALMQAGCAEVFGFDQSADSVAMAISEGLSGAQQLDVTVAAEAPLQGDLCTSFEVGEHIPKRFASNYCSLLSRIAPIVVMTVAPPGQGGHFHMNEQPRQYWVELMKSLGMQFDKTATEFLQNAWRGNVAEHYFRNLLVFRRI
ncbi:MAG: methyltransferase domain-containing protein [Tepidisphaeraceae bacterium]